ncbi:hypothetical protein F2Q69_00022759 [Brassica cretica]|uniref:Malectin-like domain-containing protein n=1 Tax=Brassica cretica TaxID=69181 RepID=A0A8S9QGS8_BRACR|nr:hypothetical protein F2Q69_00022759 [Brassica cretica]
MSGLATLLCLCGRGCRDVWASDATGDGHAETFVPSTLLERAGVFCLFMLELNFHSGSSIYSSQWFACLASHTSRSNFPVTHPSFRSPLRIIIYYVIWEDTGVSDKVLIHWVNGLTLLETKAKGEQTNKDKIYDKIIALEWRTSPYVAARETTQLAIFWKEVVVASGNVNGRRHYLLVDGQHVNPIIRFLSSHDGTPKPQAAIPGKRFYGDYND